MEGTIRVTATARGSLRATAARLHVKLEGERAVFGNAALSESRELRDLVTRLKALGLEESAFSLDAVRVSGPGGLLKASKAEFRLVIMETRLERLPQVIAALSETKNGELQSLEWVWDEFEASLPLAARAMTLAERKARAMSEAVKARVIGLRNASDSWNMPESVVMFEGMAGSAKMMSRAREADIGFEYRSERVLEVTVTADFAVSNPEGERWNSL